MSNKKWAAAALSVVMLAGCGNKNAELESFYKQVEAANKKEAPITDSSKQLEKLENEKIDMFNKINKGNIKTINKTAQQLLDNVEKRKKVIAEEKTAITQSEKTFDKAVDEAKKITDKDRKKEAQDIIDKMDEKYADHHELMKAYEGILANETDIFKYLKGSAPDGKVVNQKIEKLNKVTADFQKKTTDYTKITQQVEKEKKDVVDILNNK